MIKYLLFLCLFATQDIAVTNICNSGCTMQAPGNEYRFKDLPRYKRHDDDGKAKEACGKIIENRTNKYSMSLTEFSPMFDSSYIRIADSNFVKTYNGNVVTFYRAKRKYIAADWFTIIEPKSCSAKWVVRVDQKDFASFEKTISAISFTQH
ncbi:hypothetical protein [Taibaiella koreensis]|uniref:hypothetical protein n=1 Tax=Taibaiella koreensis TaxID=1268548 RepID=UPI000E59D504|nr:hypothetical protein [Taibaiella koreensis]